MEAMVELPSVVQVQIAHWLSETASTQEASVRNATTHLQAAQNSPKFALYLLMLSAGKTFSLNRATVTVCRNVWSLAMLNGMRPLGRYSVYPGTCEHWWLSLTKLDNEVFNIELRTDWTTFSTPTDNWMAIELVLNSWSWQYIGVNTWRKASVMKSAVRFCGRGSRERAENSCSDILEEFFDIPLEWREFNVRHREAGISEPAHGYSVARRRSCPEALVRSCKSACVNWFRVICSVNLDDQLPHVFLDILS